MVVPYYWHMMTTIDTEYDIIIGMDTVIIQVAIPPILNIIDTTTISDIDDSKKITSFVQPIW